VYVTDAFITKFLDLYFTLHRNENISVKELNRNHSQVKEEVYVHCVYFPLSQKHITYKRLLIDLNV
jgi:hypothetical protein